LACDLMIWAYVEDYSYEDEEEYPEDFAVQPPFRGTRALIAVDLGEGSFINTKDDSTEKNIDNNSYKTNRLVKAGEELIVDYGEFEQPGGWAAAGFGSEKYDIEQGTLLLSH
jgi:hypothetical protein